jgi:anti-sigma regulatory factor (Ser/Thr protein kinase)
LLDARLQDPVAAARAVRVTARWNQAKVLLAISDEGNGFTPQISSNSSEAASGRGLALVRALASSVRWNQRHRSLILTFDTTRQTGA